MPNGWDKEGVRVGSGKELLEHLPEHIIIDAEYLVKEKVKLEDIHAQVIQLTSQLSQLTRLVIGDFDSTIDKVNSVPALERSNNLVLAEVKVAELEGKLEVLQAEVEGHKKTKAGVAHK